MIYTESLKSEYVNVNNSLNKGKDPKLHWINYSVITLKKTRHNIIQDKLLCNNLEKRIDTIQRRINYSEKKKVSITPNISRKIYTYKYF